MGYTVDLQGSDLRCRSEADARAAAEVVERHSDHCPRHFEVAPWSLANPARDDAWALSIEYFEGDHWDDPEARKLWLALAPQLADGATIEFQGEDFSRWRIRWEAGRVFEEYPKKVIWAVSCEITAKSETPAPG
jgi:hypothetical protein